MGPINGLAGRCLTCNNAPGCFHLARRGPALYCELFDGFETPVRRFEPTPSRWKESPEADVLGAFTEVRNHGLCMNCLQRVACTHAAQPEGVWHCEDYR